MAVVRMRTIPTERPPLVDEVSANLCVLRSFLNEKVAAPVQKTEINDRGNSLR
jgi:hypothetical protein